MTHTMMRAAALLLLVPGALRAQAASDPRVDRIFAAYDRADSPGCAVGVVRDGRFVLQRGYGAADLDHAIPNGPAMVYYVGSVSKQFTAAAIGLLALDGRISLDDPVRKWVPELPDYGTPLTVRHLVHHTSGIRDIYSLMSLRGDRLEDVYPDSQAVALITRQKATAFTPGTRYSYSNSGYLLLGLIVRRASGQSLREFAQARIFGPLGMTRTHFHDDGQHVLPVVVEVRARHAERPEDARLRELAQRLPARAPDDEPEQQVAGVAVRVARPRRERGRLLPRDERHRLRVRVHVLQPVAAQRHERVDVADPARVVHEVPHRQRRAVVRQLRHPLAHGIVERDAPVEREQPDRRRRELLRHAADVVDHRRPVGDRVVEVRRAVAALQHEAAVAHHADRAPGRVGAVVRGEDAVDARVGGGLRAQCARHEEEERGRAHHRVCHDRGVEDAMVTATSASAPRNAPYAAAARSIARRCTFESGTSGASSTTTRERASTLAHDPTNWPSTVMVCAKIPRLSVVRPARSSRSSSGARSLKPTNCSS